MKQYDLEERTYRFAINVRNYTKSLICSMSNRVYISQLIRSSSSIAANYIEANEASSKKDFRHKIRICIREAKESRLWLRLLEVSPLDKGAQIKYINEVTEIIKIFSSIHINSG